ncbi:hypothetical protein [Flaviaesturariibacter aridisoli]|uniref:Uncharacterized protein n=1 Tax=Flaviaesturariibacter aridisoli TaxID=2545761 RepID=A0A4R4E0R9_9BACT|nr:hypothetical protein [Flaviaesturariibacter aridisoli]TCZ67737.1 hypothetical protein E0486_15360 [Flaviaesturariibacter aridisoli]
MDRISTTGFFQPGLSGAAMGTAVLQHGIASHEAFCAYRKKRTLPGSPAAESRASAYTTMFTDRTIPVDATLLSFVYEKASDSWLLTCTGSIAITVYSVWRLLKAQKVIAVSPDHGQWFGLSSPLNLAQEVFGRLQAQRLLSIAIQKDTGDLHLHFDNDYLLEVLITSANYECYDLAIGAERYIATGGGA